MSYTRLPAPAGPVDLDEVMALYPEVRQSLLQRFDDCPLSSLFELRWGQGWSTHPQASGLIFHRVAAECLREMQRNDSESIPVGVALEILREALEQNDVPPEEIVRVPLRDIPNLRMVVAKFARDNSFSIRDIIDIERRMGADLTYVDRNGEQRVRRLTGQLDVLLAPVAGEAVVVDWKNSWALPPERHEDDEQPGLSYHGYFQQRFYGWLVFMNFPSVDAVTLREFYPRRTEVRKGRILRTELPKIAEELAILVKEFDRAVSEGPPRTLKLEDVERTRWTPQPGKHCDFCVAPQRCPVEDEAALPKAVRTADQAKRWAAARVVAMRVKKKADEILKPYAEEHGPIPVKNAKGRRVIGVRPIGDGSKTQFTEYTPKSAEDRPPTPGPEDKPLIDAMRDATRRKQAA